MDAMQELPQTKAYGQYVFSRATAEEATFVSRHLRREDMLEAVFIEYTLGGKRTPAQMVTHAFAHSAVCYAMRRKGKLVGIGGLGFYGEGQNGWWAPWLVGTPQLTRFPGAFGAIAVFFRQVVSPVFNRMVNLAAWPVGDGDNPLPGWLESMGFHVQPFYRTGGKGPQWQMVAFSYNSKQENTACAVKSSSLRQCRAAGL